LFLIFLALCQLALVASAEAIVRHAAYAGVRSAIVVLEDDPDRFDGAPRGSLSTGRAERIDGLEELASKFEIEDVEVARRPAQFPDGLVDLASTQQGARMVPIRAASLTPLLPVAPNEQLLRESSQTVSGALGRLDARQLGFAVEYTKSASMVSIHDSPQEEALAHQPIKGKSAVTVRVTYLFHCTVPVVRALMCSSLDAIANRGKLAMAVSYKTARLVGTDARFKLLTGIATLPNQGADYLAGEPR
jgi:hypothetical protein